MGIIKRGILGGFSGKVANIVGSSWKGISIMKSLPLSVANPRTAAQIAQRTKFRGAVQMAASMLTSIVKPLWDRFAQQESGFNAFISTNIQNFDQDGSIIDYEDLIISKGKMEKTEFTGAIILNTGAGSIDWNNDSGEGLKLASDTAYLAVFKDEEEIPQFAGGNLAIRDEGEFFFTMPTPMTDIQYHAYLCFRRADGTVVSDTAYLVINPTT